MYKIVFAQQAAKDTKKLARAGLAEKAKALTQIIKINPYQTPPPYEKLIGDLQGRYSRRVNGQHRYIYQILPNDKGGTDANGEPFTGVIKVLRMWMHYE